MSTGPGQWQVPAGLAADDDFRVLAGILRDLESPRVAVSGGVDSMLLGLLAHRCNPDARLFHAVSPAVPVQATARVEQYAAREKWHLTLLDAGEMRDPAYRDNPVNRCYYCKSRLYAAIGARGGGQVVAGTNLDDLEDYRPGLDAARAAGVRHPFVEAGITKAAIRAMADRLGLHDLAALPASPCLSSRITTGIAIDAAVLPLIDQAESRLRTITGAGSHNNVRCRLRRDALCIEVDSQLLRSGDVSERLKEEVQAVFSGYLASNPRLVVTIAPYVRGSAFVGRESQS